MNSPHIPEVMPFFDAATSTFSYVVFHPGSDAAIVIDPVLDYDPKAGHVATRSADQLMAAVTTRGLRVEWILETHVHADHLTAATYIKSELGGAIGIGAEVTGVQAAFKEILGLGAEFVPDGSQFDRLFRDEESFTVGALEVHVVPTPGHTNDSVTYMIGGTAFVGDTLFMPDYGTARCDFPGGDARKLYQSIQRILNLPRDTRLFLCHDYPPGEREPAYLTTPEVQRNDNVHLRAAATEDAFVAMRKSRDANLAKPVLLWPSVQVNIRAGRFPAPESNQRRYLRIPLSGI